MKYLEKFPSLFRSYTKKKTEGFSTLEMLIAMTILILTLSAVITTSFGGQSLLIDSQTNAEALGIAQKGLESIQTLARKDYFLVNPTTTDETIGGLTYHQVVSVETQPDFMTKKIVSAVAWSGEHNRPQHVELSALVTNFQNAIGGDTCDSVLHGDWVHPVIENALTNFAQLVGDPSGAYPITDLDAAHGKLYASVNNTAANTKETLFVFDIVTNPFSPTLLGKADNAPVSAGINAVRVAGNYAYTANAYGANFTTCTESSSCAQLEVFDVSGAVPVLVKSYKIAGVTGNAGQGAGQSIVYKDGYVYLGLSKTLAGPEFNIIDVHNPSAPLLVGSYAVGNGVNAIYIKDDFAYLATPNTQELTVLDVSNPTTPVAVGGFNSPSGNGKSIAVVGDRLYLGKTIGGNEFYVLDDKDPKTTLPSLGSYDMGSESINGVVLRDTLAMLLTNTALNVVKVSDPSSMTLYAPTPLTLPASGSTIEPSMDCEGNVLYVSSNDSGNKGYLSAISAP